MIDMSALYAHQDYSNTLNNFQNRVTANNDCNYEDWKLFIDVQMSVSKNRCPICESPLDDSLERNSNTGKTTIKPTIDHYRPQILYPNLKCTHQNYLLMCSDCNNVYKGNDFPLYPTNAQHTQSASSYTDVLHERPLLVNPINDKPLNMFRLVFRRLGQNVDILELEPLVDDDYINKKAKTTIEVFGLGSCRPNQSSNVENCRINLLSNHYNKFFNLALAINNMNEADFFNAMVEFKNGDLNKALKYNSFDDVLEALKNVPNDYGFLSFLFNKQFKII